MAWLIAENILVFTCCCCLFVFVGGIFDDPGKGPSKFVSININT